MKSGCKQIIKYHSKKYSTTKKDFFAIHLGLREFQYLCLSYEIVLLTDHKPITAFESCLKTVQHFIYVIIRKIKKIIHVCWIPYLLMILLTLWSNIFIIRIIIGDAIQ